MGFEDNAKMEVQCTVWLMSQEPLEPDKITEESATVRVLILNA